MDSEKYLALEKKLETGESPNDEGPFYHHSWWESYKGSIKGKVGGIVIGAVMGAVVGGAVAGAMAMGLLGAALAAEAATIGMAFMGFVGAGIVYGMYEFGEIGKIVGAQSAVQEQADAREAIRFSAIEKKIDALTKLVHKQQGDTKEPYKEIDTSVETEALATYRKSHFAKLNGSTKGPVFWKVALIGLAVGAAAGVILAVGGAQSIAYGALSHIIHIQSANGLMAASAGVMGMFGASFGINRDYFRKIFDTTDLWTKGILRNPKVEKHQEEAGKLVEKKNGKATGHGDEIATIVTTPEGISEHVQSATFHRDRVGTAAERALLSFDHTRAIQH